MRRVTYPAERAEPLKSEAKESVNPWTPRVGINCHTRRVLTPTAALSLSPVCVRGESGRGSGVLVGQTV